jgi:hypothetical protein
MRCLLPAAALLTALAAPALGQQAGTYGVQGEAPGGQRYQGMATLQPTGTNTWRVTWQVGNDTAEGVGFLIPEGPLLVVGYVIGREIGAVAYAVQADGTLQGTWTQGQGGGIGTEVLTPAGTGGGQVRK